jgi:peptidoglycan/xylan/chitin deacetylase (PgdA/CDA1 family)
VQLHGNRHLRHTEHDRATIEGDTDAALARLDLLGVRPTLWRLPWGREASWSPAIAADRGLRIVGWDADTHDWRGDSAATMLDAVAGDLRDGCIVLAHDGLGPGARRDGCAETVALVGDLVRLADERGLACVPVGENGAVAR